MKHQCWRASVGEAGLSWEHAKEHAITAVLLLLFFFGFAIIFAPLWIPIVPYLESTMEVVGGIFFFLSIVMFLSIIWNISFYHKIRKELLVARKLIRWVASQRNVRPRTDVERERINRLLKAAIWALRNGEDVQAVIDGLIQGTRNGKDLNEGWARLHYETVIERLTNATRRDQVLNWEERKEDLLEGEKILWATMAENH